MSKGWLEDVEGFLDNTYLTAHVGDGSSPIMVSDEAYKLLHFAKEKAERVQELEKQLEKSRQGLYNCNMCYKRSEQQNKRYRELLIVLRGKAAECLLTGKEMSPHFIDELTKHALDGDCIHCNGKGFNGLDWCTQCNLREVIGDE